MPVRFAGIRGRGPLAGALIVTARIGPPDFAWLDELRRLHYPPERNRVPAHLTLVRTLPPSAEDEAARALARAAAGRAPAATLSSIMELNSGVAFRIRSPDLERLREELAAQFQGLLSAPDRNGWIGHVTIQNKAPPSETKRLLQALRAMFVPRPLAINGLQLVRYREGKWEEARSWSFRGIS